MRYDGHSGEERRTYLDPPNLRDMHDDPSDAWSQRFGPDPEAFSDADLPPARWVGITLMAVLVVIVLGIIALITMAVSIGGVVDQNTRPTPTVFSSSVQDRVSWPTWKRRHHPVAQCPPGHCRVTIPERPHGHW